MSTTETALLFFGYSLICLVVLGFAARLAIKRRDLPGFVCTPIGCLTLVVENLFLGIEFVAGTPEDVATLTSIRFIVHSLVVPLFIIACFELGYQVHKKRGVNYCCIRFEEGHRNQNDTIAQMLRFFPWVLAVAVCVLSLIANAPHINDPTSQDAERFHNEQLNFSGDNLSSVMDFLPPLSLVCIAAYAGGSLWKYGTYYAMEVHATTINPWVFLFLAAIFHLVAGLVTSDQWSGPFLTNGAELVLATAVVHATYRVDMNLEEIRELGDDLHETNQMSKAIQDANKRASGAAPHTAPPAVGASDVDIERALEHSNNESDSERQVEMRTGAASDSYSD